MRSAWAALAHNPPAGEILASIWPSSRLADCSLSFDGSPAQAVPVFQRKADGVRGNLRGLCSFRHALAFPVDHLTSRERERVLLRFLDRNLGLDLSKQSFR